MTTSINLETLADVTRRDRWGRYLIVPTTGGAPVGYTRVTTIAKELASSGGLAPWKAAMTAQGLIMRRGLRAQWEALLAEHGSNAWYGGERAKAECKRLVEECAAVGGANDRREMGELLHTITALVDTGRTPTHLTEETEADLKAYVEGLASRGVVVDRNYVEVTVVLDAYQVAGTFDRLVHIPGFDLPLIADLKTGSDLSYSWQSIAVQMAAYSRANAVYRQGAAKDGSEDERIIMPPVDQKYGLVIWLGAGTGELELFLVELEPGWDAFQHSMWARNWRSQSVAFPLADLGHEVQATTPENLTPLLEASVAEAEAARPERRREWLQKRIDAVGHHDEAKATFARRWPPGVPSLRSSTDHTSAQLDAIQELCDDTERLYRLAFPEDPVRLDGAIGELLDLFKPPNNDKEQT